MEKDSVCLRNASKNDEPLAATDHLPSKDNNNNADKSYQPCDSTEIHVDRTPADAESLQKLITDPAVKDSYHPNKTHSLNLDEGALECVQSSPDLTHAIHHLRCLENVPTEELIAQLKR